MRLLWMVVLAGCVHHGTPASSSEGFAVSYPDAQHATVKKGARFYAKPEAKCVHEDTGTEARWSIAGAHVTSGALPAGLTLEDGVIGGVAKEPGNYHARIEMTAACAGKEQSQAVDVDITVD